MKATIEQDWPGGKGRAVRIDGATIGKPQFVLFDDVHDALGFCQSINSEPEPKRESVWTDELLRELPWPDKGYVCLSRFAARAAAAVFNAMLIEHNGQRLACEPKDVNALIQGVVHKVAAESATIGRERGELLANAKPLPETKHD